jgi:two-component system C4-dicarboxylate transport response regulator DctD
MLERIARPRLLIVESDETVRRVLGRILASRFEVTPLEHGLRALARLKEQRFDVMLLDLAAKDGSAMHLFREIRALDPRLPVIVTTSAPAHAIAIAIAPGVACVSKPYHAAELVRVLEHALGRGR